MSDTPAPDAENTHQTLPRRFSWQLWLVWTAAITITGGIIYPLVTPLIIGLVDAIIPHSSQPNSNLGLNLTGVLSIPTDPAVIMVNQGIQLLLPSLFVASTQWLVIRRHLNRNRLWIPLTLLSAVMTWAALSYASSLLISRIAYSTASEATRLLASEALFLDAAYILIPSLSTGLLQGMLLGSRRRLLLWIGALVLAHVILLFMPQSLTHVYVTYGIEAAITGLLIASWWDSSSSTINQAMRLVIYRVRQTYRAVAWLVPGN